MRLSRFLTEDRIKLEMTTVIEPAAEGVSAERWLQEGKRLIINELVELLETNSRIGNRTKLTNDFVNREKKASTGIGNGIALPHIRSLQAKELTVGFARSSLGYDFGSLDGKPTHLFFVMAAPPYDDSMYLKIFKSLAEMLQYEAHREELLSATSAGEIIRAIKGME
jgi:mannitol/fructose-specific phosphotransferase system IIA component (Ntr-type)